jgi:integrase
VFVRFQGKRWNGPVGDEETARDMATEIQREIRTGRFSFEALKAARTPQEKQPDAPLLKVYYERFEKVYLATSCREGTRDRYATSFDKHILPQLGGLRLDEITRERLIDFVAHLVAKRYQKRVKIKTYPDPKKKRNPQIEWKTVEVPLSKTSIRIILNGLCSVFSHAVEEKAIESNPAIKLGKFYKQAKNIREKIEPLSGEEVQSFLAAVLDRSWSKDYYPVFLCALHTGMRASEIVGLQWGDVDFRGKFFLLRRQFTRGRIEPTKTDRARRVDMSDALALGGHFKTGQ